MKKLLNGHSSPETAYIVEDYPYGFRLRCKMRCWVETATKGKGKGEMRYMTQTTNPKITSTEIWNKPKAGTYSSLVVMYIDTETNHVHCEHLSKWGDGADRYLKFKEEYYDQMDEATKKIYDHLEKINKVINPESWSKVTV